MAQMCLIPYKLEPGMMKIFKEIPMLPKYSHQATTLLKIQCLVILSLTFFNMFSWKYHDFNFQTWKESEPEKLKAIFNYILRILSLYNSRDQEHMKLEVHYRRNSYKDESDHIIDYIKKSSTIIKPDTTKLNFVNNPRMSIEKMDSSVQAVFAHAYRWTYS